MHFLEWKWWNSDSNFPEICSQESNWQYPSISSGNGLAPDRRQAITWTKADPKLNQSWRIFTSLRRYTCPSVKAIMCGSDYVCWVFGANVIPEPMLCINIHSKFNKYDFFKKMYCKFCKQNILPFCGSQCDKQKSHEFLIWMPLNMKSPIL